MPNCVICGTEFSKSREHHQIYCSKKCKSKSQNVNSVLNCVICGTEFHNKGHSSTCSKECQKKKRLNWQRDYSRTPEARAKKKILRATPKAKEKSRISSRLRSQRPEIKAKTKKSLQERTTQFKLEVFTHYSKEISDSDVPICACCKIDDIRFLTLDHIEGRKHLSKKEQKLKTLALWRHVKNIGFPEGYQVLCYNCNIAKGTMHFCPHEIDRMEDEIRKGMKK